MPLDWYMSRFAAIRPTCRLPSANIQYVVRLNLYGRFYLTLEQERGTCEERGDRWKGSHDPWSPLPDRDGQGQP